MHRFHGKRMVRKPVLGLDKEPLFCFAFHADKDKETVQFFAMQDKFDPPVRTLPLMRSYVPWSQMNTSPAP